MEVEYLQARKGQKASLDCDRKPENLRWTSVERHVSVPSARGKGNNSFWELRTISQAPEESRNRQPRDGTTHHGLSPTP